jgi:hypothetical protein
LITNTNQGARYQLTAQISKSYPFGLSFMAAYTYGQSKDILNGIRNSPESGWQLNQALNPNQPGLTYSNFDIRHRIVSTIQYKKSWGEKGASYISLIPTFQSGSPFTYAINSNSLTGNGQQVDLFYIPKNNGENPYNLSASQLADFNNFIDVDSYLSKHRGEYTTRNGARTPWNNQMDLRLMHDFNFKVGGGKTNTLQVTFDIINFSNMLNKNWGVYYYTPNTLNSSVDPGLSITSKVYNPSTQTYTVNATYKTPTAKWSIDQFSSRWQAQVGVRYSF